MSYSILSRPFGRRTLLKSTAAAGAGLAMPAVIGSSALASSGEINILMWSDYLPESFTKAFTEKTGIKVNFTGIGSNDERLNKLKATKGEGLDLVTPTVNREEEPSSFSGTMPTPRRAVC